APAPKRFPAAAWRFAGRPMPVWRNPDWPGWPRHWLPPDRWPIASGWVARWLRLWLDPALPAPKQPRFSPAEYRFAKWSFERPENPAPVSLSPAPQSVIPRIAEFADRCWRFVIWHFPAPAPTPSAPMP